MTKEKSIKLKSSLKRSLSKSSLKRSLSKSTKLDKSISNNSNLCNDDINIQIFQDDEPFSKSTLNNLNFLLLNSTTRRIFIDFSEKEHSHNHILFWHEVKEFKEKFIPIPPDALDKSSKPETQQSMDSMDSTDMDSQVGNGANTGPALTNAVNSVPDLNINTPSPAAAAANNNKSTTTALSKDIIFPQQEQIESSNDSNIIDKTMTVQIIDSPMVAANNSNTTNNNVVSVVDIQQKENTPTTTTDDVTTTTTTTNNNIIPIQQISSNNLSTIEENRVSRESNTDESDDEDEVTTIQKANLKNALYIFEKYLNPSSKLEVNLDYKTFIEIKKKIEQKEITNSIFEKSQKEIFEVIYNDSYFRFKSSNTFKHLLICTEQFESSSSISAIVSSQSQSSSSSPSSPSSPSTISSNNNNNNSNSNNTKKPEMVGEKPKKFFCF
ncbi:hypothetical protein CYY_007085 [Polysphondylium violaceum]|uniref:RGS domain-containing protein n=1 Tax=Polysphondylium violaceum TaxID=133409 RepID=A0A8J4UXW3_9MYCE|nr:hypothetical protein CYY_007085 [Polysphondylium violaceum]